MPPHYVFDQWQDIYKELYKLNRRYHLKLWMLFVWMKQPLYHYPLGCPNYIQLYFNFNIVNCGSKAVPTTVFWESQRRKEFQNYDRGRSFINAKFEQWIHLLRFITKSWFLDELFLPIKTNRHDQWQMRYLGRDLVWMERNWGGLFKIPQVFDQCLWSRQWK